MKTKIKLLAAGFAAAMACGARAAEDWYLDAKLGMFVHWGLYAADGQGEWAMFRNGIAPEDYARHAEAWNPETGCEERWVRMAKDAGVRYMVLTTRHHDGFSLWDTKTDAFNSMNTPAKRDHVRAYVEACRKHGMKVGLYYSLVDWRLRDTDPAKMKANAWAQLEELMTKYGRIDVLWYDGSWHPKGMTTAEFWESERLNAKIRAWQPGILINDRSGTKEDFQTIEGRNIPRPPEGAKRWESCLTLQDDDWSFWGYCNHTAFRKTPEQIVCQLIHCLELGGNLLVNVGPDARGEIDPWQCDLFAKVGGWIAAHKDAVYGSRPTEVAAKTPLAKGWSGNSCGFFTEADDRYYLFLHAWPGERTTFPYFTGCVKAVRLDGREISFELDASEHRLTLTGLPKDPPDDVCPVLELFKDAVPAVCPVVAFADRVPREKGEIFRLDSGDLVDVVPERTVNFGMGVYHWERVRRPELLARLDASFGWREAKGKMPDSLDVTWPEGDGQVPALVFLCGDGVAALPDEQVAQAVKRGYAVARLDVAGLPVAAAAKTAIAAYDLLRREARVDCAHIGVYGFGATCGRAAYLAGAHEMRFALAAAVDADVPKELLALQAPHLASVGASGADVVRARREFDAAVAATPAWYDYGLSGLDITIFPGEDDLNYGGTLEYFRRPGGSAPALCDLNRILDFCDWRHWRHAPGTPARVERLPDLLTSPKTGRAVTTKEGWEKELRPEIVEFYTREVYGRRPVERPEALTFTTVGRDTPVCGGKGVRREVKISFRAKYGEMSFSAVAFIPKRANGSAAPAFLCITCMDDPFRRRKTFSDETIGMALDRGYAMVGYWGKDFLPDMSLDPSERKGWQGKFVFGNYEKPEERTRESWGAISVWAWTASRVLDWLETVPEIDAKRVAVAGNSRAGKTALWAGVTDTRFAMVCPNCSGCLGARLSHIDLDGVERMGPLMRLQTFWFCDNIWKWSDTDRFEFPYDQHQLAACIAPRLLAVGTGSDDIGAGPEGEFLMARAASPAWELYGMKGLASDTVYPGVDSNLITEGVGFHRRPGGHYLGYGNWKRFMDFADAHGWNKE